MLAMAPLLLVGCHGEAAQGSELDSNGSQEQQGIWADDFLGSPFTLADAVVTQLRAHADEMSNDGFLMPYATELMVQRGGREGVVLAFVSVRLDQEGQITLSGSATGYRVDGEFFPEGVDPAREACVSLLSLVTDNLLGRTRVGWHGLLGPVSTYLQMMGGAAVRDPESAILAAEVLWENTRGSFRLTEAAMDRTTECSVTATPDGWTGDTFGY